MKDVRTISRDKDFFKQMKRIMGEKTWCFIDQKVIEHLKKETGFFAIDCIERSMNIAFYGKYISIEYSAANLWHRIRCLKTSEMERNVCKDPEEVVFVTME